MKHTIIIEIFSLFLLIFLVFQLSFIMMKQITTASENIKPKISNPLPLINYTDIQKKCLYKNIYFEARNQSSLGQMAVAFVTLNRVKSNKFPNTICKVVYQSYKDKYGNPIKNKCQFSWVCSGFINNVRNQKSWKLAQNIGSVVLNHYEKNGYDPTEGSLWYYADYIKPPYWAKEKKFNVQIDNHKFYS